MSPTSARERRCGDSPFQRPAGLTQPAPPLGCRRGRGLHPDLGLVLGQDLAAGRRLQDVQALPRSSGVEAGAQFAGCAGIRLPGLQEPLKVVPSAADGMAGHPQQHQNGPDDEHNYPDSPENGDLEDETYNEENNAKNNHVRLPEIRESVDP
jgi:hypothetical protein